MQCRFCKSYEMQGRQRGTCTALGGMVQGKWAVCRLFVPALSQRVPLPDPDTADTHEGGLLLQELSLIKLLGDMTPAPMTAETPSTLEVLP